MAMYRNVSKCSTTITTRWGKGRLMMTLKQHRIKEAFFTFVNWTIDKSGHKWWLVFWSAVRGTRRGTWTDGCATWRSFFELGTLGVWNAITSATESDDCPSWGSFPELVTCSLSESSFFPISSESKAYYSFMIYIHTYILGWLKKVGTLNKNLLEIHYKYILHFERI